jgi:hypothetical protein
MENNKCEQTTINQETFKEEIDRYGQHQNIITANRDGDLFYIECPECHSTDLNSNRLICCRNCHTFFSLYFEDGFKVFWTETNNGTIHGYDNKIKLIQLKKNDVFLKYLMPRNEHRIEELKKDYPDLKVITLMRDFKDGTDGHKHEKYKKYALIPL